MERFYEISVPSANCFVENLSAAILLDKCKFIEG